MGLTVGVFALKLDESATALSMKARTAEAFETTSAVFNSWRIDPWKE
jgi:hypothetical protein